MYEAMTSEKILLDALSRAPNDIDTRPGSIYYDAVAGMSLKIAQLYSDLDILAKLISIDTTGGVFLDEKAKEHGLVRNPATKSKFYFIYTGNKPSVGTRFYTNGLYFTLIEEDNILYLESEYAGEVSNKIQVGTQAVPVNNIAGLQSASFGDIVLYGSEEETDDELRYRLKTKISTPAENGNASHYKVWCESIEGIGRAKILPLYDGPNTVKAILISPNGTNVSDSVVLSVQNYIDPDDDGDGIGDGLGEGVANLGAHFIAVSAKSFELNISLTVIPNGNVDQDIIINDIELAVSNYLRKIILSSSENETFISHAAIGSAIYNIESILSYSELLINESMTDIKLEATYVPIVGVVKVNDP